MPVTSWCYLAEKVPTSLRSDICFCQWFIGIGGLLGIAFCVMRQTGHKNPATVETYAREKNSLMNNAVANIGL